VAGIAEATVARTTATDFNSHISNQHFSLRRTEPCL
jgi:hypothetical protein